MTVMLFYICSELDLMIYAGGKVSNQEYLYEKP